MDRDPSNLAAGEADPPGAGASRQITLAPDYEARVIHLDFGEVTRHISLSLDEARQMAAEVRRAANRIERGFAPGKRRPRKRR